MRKVQKAQADDFLKILQQAHNQLRKLIELRDIKNALLLLQDCQEGAVALGTMIEQAEGEGVKAVSILEEYCESVYQIYNNLSSNEDMSANKAYKILNQLWVRISNNIANDIVVKKEVVFLPYKASMWDSFESVWRAAEDDPDCDAYVVPIPYYDRNSDGSLGKLHYEGSQYPAYVQIIHYDAYDLETRKPDIVFIHSPYDECNYVTSVAPRFYSKNLRHYVDKLIYIPYFVLGEGMYESMCVTPGTLLADYVIAHSEKAKDDYIKYLKKFYIQNAVMKAEEAENMLRRKILPLGSPKIDKVINGKKEDYKLPEQWKKLLESKKAVLYNTGVSGILNGNEQELKKIKDTIAFFASRDDVLLWWRPHPLIGATVQSMRNHLLNEYLELVAEYKSLGIGIYDDTADLHRAVFWTDIYYGDDSSVIYLYGVQGKPIVMQNIYYLTTDDVVGSAQSVRYRISCEVLGDIYFFALEYNCLYRLDMSSGRIIVVSDVPGEQKMETSLYSGMFFRDGTIWLVPSRAHALAAYCLETGQWEFYDLPDRIKSYTQTEDKIYMISSDYKMLWCMNMYEKKLERKEIFYQQKESFSKSDESYSIDSYLIDGNLYYLIAYTNIIAMCDIERGQAKLLHVGAEQNQYQRMVYDGNCFWFLSGNNKLGIVCWNGKQVIESDADSYPKGFSALWGFKNFICVDEYIWLFPYKGNAILCFNKKTKQITRVLEMSRIFGEEIVNIDNTLLLSDGRIVVSASKTNTDSFIVFFNDDCEMAVEYSSTCADEKRIAYNQIFERLEQEKYTSIYAYQISEGNIYTLKRVCDALIKSEHTYSAMKSYFRSLYANSDGTAGVHIWEEVKGC